MARSKRCSVMMCVCGLFCVACWGGPVDVRDFGAAGDGKADDTAAFVKALAAGRDVYVPAGRYRLRTVDLPDNTRVRGAGAGSVLVLDASCREKHLLGMGNNCTVEDLALTGLERTVKTTSNEEPCLVHIDGKRNVTARNLHVYDYGFTGIGCWRSEDMTIQGNTLRNLNEGIRLRNCHRASVRNNTVVDMKFHGIEFWGNSQWKAKTSSDLMFVGNIVRNGGGGAIWGAGTKRLIMAANIVDGATDVGLDPEWCEAVAIQGNVARRCHNAGISLFFRCENVSITGNTVRNDRPISPEDAKKAWFVRSAIWITPTNRQTYKHDTGHENVAVVGNTTFSAPGTRRDMWIGSEVSNVRIEANVVSKDPKILYGGHHAVHPQRLATLENQPIHLNNRPTPDKPKF